MNTDKERIKNGECVSPYTTDHCPHCVDTCDASMYRKEKAKEEYEKALETVRKYNSERFINVKEKSMQNGNQNKDSALVVIHNGFLQLVTPLGEIVQSNLGITITDNVNQVLTIECSFYVKMGEVVNDFQIKSVIPNIDDIFKDDDKYDNEAARIIHDHIAMGGDYEDFEGKTNKEIVEDEK